MSLLSLFEHVYEMADNRLFIFMDKIYVICQNICAHGETNFSQLLLITTKRVLYMDSTNVTDFHIKVTYWSN